MTPTETRQDIWQDAHRLVGEEWPRIANGLCQPPGLASILAGFAIKWCNLQRMPEAKVTELLEEDKRLVGIAFKRVRKDHSIERIPPDEVQILTGHEPPVPECPAGWQIVQTEAVEKMLLRVQLWESTQDGDGPPTTAEVLQRIWRIMLEAAPKPPRRARDPEDPMPDSDRLQRIFNLRWRADRRAIKRWQEAHPGNDDVWPDHADLVVWLMERLHFERAGRGGDVDHR